MPTSWDRPQFRRALRDHPAPPEIVYGCPEDADCPASLDPEAYVEAIAAGLHGPLTGVTSTSDYPGAALASMVAARLGLPGSPPEAVLLAAQKLKAREVQARVAPEHTPRFARIDPGARPVVPPDLAFPCFVKPVRGSFSVLARRVESAPELERHVTSPEAREYLDGYLSLYHRLLAAAPGLLDGARSFLAEGLLEGDLVTVEGWCRGGRAHLLGIVDSLLHPGTHSFAGFEYPSALPPDVQARMAGVACRVAEALGLRDGLFNVEMTWDQATGRLGILEVNPRAAGQFGDLYLAVDGVSSYRIALDLCQGRPPPMPAPGGRHACAGSFPLRIFSPSRFLRVPDPDEIAALEARHPDLTVWNEVRPNQVLDDFLRGEDGSSARYGVVNLAASSRPALRDRFEAIREELGYRIEPLPLPAVRQGAAGEGKAVTAPPGLMKIDPPGSPS